MLSCLRDIRRSRAREQRLVYASCSSTHASIYLFISAGCHRYGSIALTSAVSHRAAGPRSLPARSSRQTAIASPACWGSAGRQRSGGSAGSPPHRSSHCTACCSRRVQQVVTQTSPGAARSVAKMLCIPPFQSLVPPSPALARRVTISTASGQP